MSEAELLCRHCGTKLECILIANYWIWQCPDKNCKKRTWSTLQPVVETEQGGGEI